MKKALAVATVNGAKHLIGAALAKELSIIKNRRIYIAYGTTNAMLLTHLGIPKEGYYNGFVSPLGFSTHSSKPEVVILNADESPFVDELKKSDIVIKGANALSYANGAYHAAVAAASPEGGTYGRIYTKAACIGAEVIIPIGHEKLVPTIETDITQGGFDRVMGRSIALLPLYYGTIYTEITAFKKLFKLDARVITSGGILGAEGAVTFAIEGSMAHIESAISFLERYN